MSRTLSKVLVICAMVVVLPLMIVGTAFAAYYSVENIVNLAVVIDEVSPAGSVYINYNGERKENHKISEGHTKIMEATADLSAAYIFEGWFEGNAAAYADGTAEKVTTERKLSFSMEEAKDFVAVYKVVRSDVSFEYLEDPSDSSSLKQVAAKEYLYGEALPTLSYEGADWRFAGWKVQGDESGARYTTAQFKGTVALIDPWMEMEKISVTFHNGSNAVVKELYAQETWTIPSVSDALFAGLGINAEAGYSYKWSDSATGNGNVVDVVSSAVDMDLWLVREIESYTATLADTNDVKEQANAVNFTVQTFAGFENWLNLTPKYSFWSVNGIKYKDTVYTSANLSDLAKAYAADQTGTFELDVKKNFSTITIQNGVEFKASGRDGIIYDKNVYLGEANYGQNPHEVINTITTANTNAKLGQILEISGGKVYANINGIQTEVELVQIYLSMNDVSGFSVDVSADMTINDFIEACLKNPLIELSDNFVVTSMEADFAPVGV